MRFRHRLPTNRPALVVNVALGALLLAGGGWAYRTVAVASAPSTGTANLRTATVTTGAVTSTVSASGTVASASTATANFVTGGTVTEIDVAVGDVVKKGQVLAKVDPSAAKETLTTAKANLRAAKDALARAEASSTSDDATISNAEAQVASAQATVDADQRAVDGTVLTAPQAGTVIAVNGSVGNSSSGSSSSSSSGGNQSQANQGSNASSASSASSSSSGFVQIADLSKMQASASFAESDATKLKVGQAAAITWSALSGATATGKVASISPTATTANSVNSYAVVVSIDAVPDGVRIGQTITVKVTVASADNVLRVPTNAVRGAGGRYTAQVVTGSQTRTVVVEVGVTGDSYYEITSGLTAGQQVALTTTTTSSGGTNGFPGGPGGLGGIGGFNGGGGPPAGGR
jgi:macrolide-specific efflux system membrane fusion protein